jgi:O-succinylbenzoic acid--CoA ligase
MALVADGLRWTFGELSARVDLLARRLATRGVRSGDRVVTLLDPSGLAVEMVHAVQRVGATLVPLSSRLAPPEVERLVAFVRPALVVAPDAALDAEDPAPGSVLCDVVRPDEPHTIVFTSGTSGAPKGVVLTHAGHAASAAGVAARLRVTAGDRWLLCMPLCHVGGLGIVVRSVRVGFGVVVHPRFDPEAFLRTVSDERVTIVSVVATMLARLLDAAERAPSALASLRCVLVGGGPLPSPVLARALAAGLPVTQTYGLTEAASMVTSEEPGAAREAGAVGAPIPGAEVRIDEADGDGVGEILVRGPVVMAGYVDQPAATAMTLRDGWLRTGDLGRMDEDGVVHVTGRRSEVIVSGGENVHPSEVEAVLLAHPDVAEAAVYGVSDDAWGERIEAKVVFRGAPVAAEALGAWCATQLARFKVPKAFHPVRTLPRTSTGKVERAAL